MNRLLISTALFLILVVAAERMIENRFESKRVLKSQLRALPNNAGHTGDAVQEFRIDSADTAWTFRKKDGNWHYPAHENAFALNDRVRSFIKEIVESDGTIVSTRSHPKYGMGSFTVHLTDSLATWNQTVEIGSSLPGTDTREAYMKVPQSDTIYQIHADPLRGLNFERLPGRPPFLDAKILPSALSRRSMIRIAYDHNGSGAQVLERVEIEKAEDERSPTDGPTYEWYAIQSNKRSKVVDASVYAYLGYLSRLKYDNLHDPTLFPQSTKHLTLIDDQETADTLDIAERGDATFLLHRTSGHLYSIPHNKARLLFPTPALLDTLADPSPYQQAQPTGPFSLASP
jgi:hypothetical protein